MDGFSGRIEVVVGCMFSGKSEELIRRLKRAQIARQKVIALKSSLDDRYGLETIASHSGVRLESALVSSSSDVLRIVEEKQMEVVGIDEVQWFDSVSTLQSTLQGRAFALSLPVSTDFRGTVRLCGTALRLRKK